MLGWQLQTAGPLTLSNQGAAKRTYVWFQLSQALIHLGDQQLQRDGKQARLQAGKQKTGEAVATHRQESHKHSPVVDIPNPAP